MAQPPFMRFWVTAFIADTTHMSATEVGAYFLILCAMWNAGGSLPNDDAMLARIARCGPNWSRVRKAVLPLLTVDGDQITQKRLKAECVHAHTVSQKRAHIARTARAAKSLNVNDATPAIAEQNSEQNGSKLAADIRYTYGIPVPSEQESLRDAMASDAMEVRLTAEDPRDVLFGLGAQWLARRAKITEAKAKTHIGKWIKQAWSDPHAVLAIMRQAQDRKVVDPVSWITASVAARFHPKTPVAQDAKPLPSGLSKRPARP